MEIKNFDDFKTEEQDIEILSDFMAKDVSEIIRNVNKNGDLFYCTRYYADSKKNSKLNNDMIKKLEKKFIFRTYKKSGEKFHLILTISKDDFKKVCRLFFFEKQILRLNLIEMEALFGKRVRISESVKEKLKMIFSKEARKESDKKTRFLKIKKINYKDSPILRNFDILQEQPELILDYIDNIEVEEVVDMKGNSFIALP